LNDSRANLVSIIIAICSELDTGLELLLHVEAIGLGRREAGAVQTQTGESR